MNKPTFSKLRYYEQQNLELPEDLQKRFHVSPFESDIQVPEDVFRISWCTEFGNTWNYLMTLFDVDVMPPPFILDKRRNPPRSKTYVDDGNDTMVQYILGIFNSCATVHENDRGDLSAIIPYDYELRIFESNFTMEMKKIWNWRLPPHVLRAVIFHVIAHECLHYLKLATNYQKMLYDRNPETLEAVYETISNFGSFEDEMFNELLTIRTMIARFVDANYGMNPGIGFDLSKSEQSNIDLGVILNGNFDLFMRKRSPFYNDISLYINFLIMNWADQFDIFATEIHPDMKPFMENFILQDPSERDTIIEKMLKTHAKSWKAVGKPKYLLIN